MSNIFLFLKTVIKKSPGAAYYVGARRPHFCSYLERISILFFLIRRTGLVPLTIFPLVGILLHFPSNTAFKNVLLIIFSLPLNFSTG